MVKIGVWRIVESDIYWHRSSNSRGYFCFVAYSHVTELFNLLAPRLILIKKFMYHNLNQKSCLIFDREKNQNGPSSLLYNNDNLLYLFPYTFFFSYNKHHKNYLFVLKIAYLSKNHHLFSKIMNGNKI